jgi:long-chain acyl-CoA synthetase
MNAIPINRVFDLLQVLANRPQSQVLFTSQCNGLWRNYTIVDYIGYSARTSIALLEMGVVKGDRIVTITQNRAEFNFVDMGTLQLGAVHVPLTPGISTERLTDIIKAVKPKVLFVSNRSVYRNVKQLGSILDTVRIVSFELVEELTHFEEFIKKPVSEFLSRQIEEARQSVHDSDPASITFISGNHTPLHGVILSHRAHVFNIINFIENKFLSGRQKAVSVLPLAHSFERTMNYVFQYINLPVVYSDSFAMLPAVLRQFSPDAMVAVPYILEMYESKFEKEPQFIHSVKTRIQQIAANILLVPNTIPTQVKRLIYSFLKKYRSEKVKSVLGPNLDLIICGGAQLNARTLKTYFSHGIEVFEGYGLTEAGPVVTVNDRYKIKAGSAGMTMRGVNVKISSENEILVKSNGLMSGYFNSEFSPVDDEGWLHTGDTGTVDKKGFLTITGTSKDIFKLKNGLYINPLYIEKSIITKSSEIHKIWVYGHNRNHLVAIIIPVLNNNKQECFAQIKQSVESYNTSCEKPEQIKDFKIVEDDWNSGNGFINPDSTLNRQALYAHYLGLINEMYIEV